MKKNGKHKQSKSALEELIAEILLPMSGVSVVKDKGKCFSVFKEGIKFGMVKNEAFYLFSKNGEYKEIGRDQLIDTDKLLQEATKSFWYACGKVDLLKNG